MKQIGLNKIISVFIIIAVVMCGSFPAEANNYNREMDTNSLEEPVRITELANLREENSETYLLSNGDYECVVYAEDKYYKNEQGDYRLIDNRLIGCSYGDSIFCNTESKNKTYFSDSPKVIINSPEATISFEAINARNCSATIGGSKVFDKVSDICLSGDNFIAYTDAFNDTDLIYEVRPDAVKEYIILKSSSVSSTYSFTYQTNDLIAEKDMFGRIVIKDSGDNVKFILADLFAVDFAGNYTENLKLDVVCNTVGEYTVTVSIPEEYLCSPDRVFPVVIDPSTQISGGSNTNDTFVSSINSSQNYYMNSYIRTGYDSSYGTKRTFIRFNIPSSLNGKTVTDAFISLRKYSGQAPSAKAYRVTSSWTSSAVTWNNQPSWSSTPSSSTPTVVYTNWYRFYMPDLVQSWLNGTYTNYGVVIKETNESSGNSTAYYSSDAGSSVPEFHIYYQGQGYYGTRGYQPVSSSSVNCMGYALEVNAFVSGISLGIGPYSLEGYSTSMILATVKSGAETWMNNNIGSSYYYQISSYESDISPSSFRVVLRVGFYDLNGNAEWDFDENWDFHWMYQTKNNNGQWANKHGGAPSNKVGTSGGIPPTGYTSEWTEGSLVYNSNPAYYCINDIRNIWAEE